MVELELKWESGRVDGKAYAEYAHANVWWYKVWKWTSRKGLNEKGEMLKKCVGHQYQAYNPATVNAKGMPKWRRYKHMMEKREGERRDAEHIRNACVLKLFSIDTKMYGYTWNAASIVLICTCIYNTSKAKGREQWLALKKIGEEEGEDYGYANVHRYKFGQCTS